MKVTQVIMIIGATIETIAGTTIGAVTGMIIGIIRIIENIKANVLRRSLS